MTYGLSHLETNFDVLKPFWMCPGAFKLNHQHRGFEISLVSHKLY